MNLELNEILEMFKEKNVQFPEIPDYFPLRFRSNAKSYLDEYFKDAIKLALKKIEDPNYGIIMGEKISDNSLMGSELISHCWNFGWLLPSRVNPSNILSNQYSISENVNVDTSKIDECLGGLIIEENLGLVLGFHIYPVDGGGPINQHADTYDKRPIPETMALNYFQKLQNIAPFTPTRIDVASGRGGWRLNDNKWEKKEIYTHTLLISAIEKTFGKTIPISKWTSPSIKYDSASGKVIELGNQQELPKEGATDFWQITDFWKQNYRV